MSRDVTMCHPQLQELANKLVAECKKKGLIVKLGECFRSVAEQDALYAQGRTTAGNIVTNAKGSSYSSMHQWGVAFDVIRNDGKGAYNDNDGWFSKVGKVGKSLGLEWGGDWTSPVDKPHFQLSQWGSTPAKLKQLYGNVEKFKKTWNYYVSAENIKEDDEMVETGTISVNGKNIKIDKIVKDGVTYIKLRGLENAGFEVGYDAGSKNLILNNKINDLPVVVEGVDHKLPAVNIKGYNYLTVRSFAELLGLDTEYDSKSGKVILK